MLQRAAFVAVLIGVSAADAVETVRIAMSGQPASIRAEGGRLSVGQDDDGEAFAPVRSDVGNVRLEAGRLLLNGSAVTGRSLRFRAVAEEGPKILRVGALQVRGDVVVREERGALQWINVLPLEDYLVGVLGSEMPTRFPDDALRAQAVAARTYALHKKLEMLHKPYHLGSSVLSQVYGGLASEDPRTRAAVADTRGLVLTYELAPIEAYFHASCGGRTESGRDALGRDRPYLASVDCPCSALPSSRWELRLTRLELDRLFGSAGRTSLRILERSTTGRVLRLMASRTLDGVTFRERLGYGRVKSLGFEVTERGDHLVLSGRGHGHGAGLCQWGAKALAEQGWDFRRILEHYYPGSELQLLY